MGEADPGIAGFGELVQQEDGQPLIEPHEEQLFHGPHHIGKPIHHQRVGEVFGIDVLLDELLILSRGNQQGFGIRFGLHADIEGDVLQNAGGGQDADLLGPQPVEGDLLALGGEHEHPQPTGFDEYNTDAAVFPIVDDIALLVAHRIEVFPEEILLFRCEFIPKGIGTFCQFQILLRKHGNHLGFIKLKLPLF